MPTLRASVGVQVTLESQGIGAPRCPTTNLATTTVRLYGPGDILGIDKRAIVKTEPRHWITNYEPNNLAHIEFYDEDFPWRYTPARADQATHRHRPWIMLVVLEEGEFTDGSATGKPSPFIEVADLTKLPVKDELWAWAHVHANRNLGADETVIVNSTGPAIATRLTAVSERESGSRFLAYRVSAPARAQQGRIMPFSFRRSRRGAWQGSGWTSAKWTTPCAARGKPCPNAAT